MPIHFTPEEMQDRKDRTAQAIAASGLDALLMFKQESMYWLTGYDTFGFSSFQCMAMTAGGRIALLNRAPDRGTAAYTSDVTDVRIYVDVDGMDPTVDLREMLADLGLAGSRVGIELDSYGLRAVHWRMLEAKLDGFLAWTDASTLVQELRRVKSPQELAYTRRAAELADDAWDVAVDLAGVGVSEARILADMQGAVLGGGGDYAGNEMIIGSGPGALMVRYVTGRRQLDPVDQLTLEWCGVERRYHAAMMRTLLVGEASPEHRAMHAACNEALLACEEAVRPGATLGEVFTTHARVLDGAGYQKHRLNACGYGMGAVYAPVWTDWPMIYEGNPLVFQPGHVFFLHMILLDFDAGRAMTLGHSVVVTDDGCKRLSRSDLDLVVR